MSGAGFGGFAAGPSPKGGAPAKSGPQAPAVKPAAAAGTSTPPREFSFDAGAFGNAFGAAATPTSGAATRGQTRATGRGGATTSPAVTSGAGASASAGVAATPASSGAPAMGALGGGAPVPFSFKLAPKTPTTDAPEGAPAPATATGAPDFFGAKSTPSTSDEKGKSPAKDTAAAPAAFSGKSLSFGGKATSFGSFNTGAAAPAPAAAQLAPALIAVSDLCQTIMLPTQSARAAGKGSEPMTDAHLVPYLAVHPPKGKLDLRGNPLTDISAPEILTFLLANRDIVALDISETKITSAGLELICKIFCVRVLSIAAGSDDKPLRYQATAQIDDDPSRLQGLEELESIIVLNRMTMPQFQPTTLTVLWSVLGVEGAQRLAKLAQLKRLTSLVINNCNLGEEAVIPIATCLGAVPTLTDLNVSHNPIGPRGVRRLLDGVRAASHVTTLSIDGTDYGDEGCEYIAHFLMLNRSVTVLNMSNLESKRPATFVGALAIGRALLGAKHLSVIKMTHAIELGLVSALLPTLRFSACPFSGLDLALIAGLVARNSSITSILLDRLDLFLDDGIEVLVGLLRNCPRITSVSLSQINFAERGVRALSSFLESSTHFASLTIVKNPNLVDPASMRDLAAGLQANKSLTALTIRECSLTKDAFKALSQALINHPRLQKVVFFDENLEGGGMNSLSQLLARSTNLRALQLNEMTFSDDLAQTLAEGLSESASLRSLELWSVKMGIPFNAFGESNTKQRAATKALPALLAGFIPNPKKKLVLSKVSFVRNLLKSNCGPLLAELCLRLAPTLTDLTITDNELNDDGVKPIITALTSLTNMQALVLERTGVGPEGALLFPPMLRNNNFLTELSLACNRLGEEGVRTLCGAVQGSEHLQRLDLSFNLMDTAAMLMVINTARSLRSLQYLGLDGHDKILEKAPLPPAAVEELAGNRVLLHYHLGQFTARQVAASLMRRNRQLRIEDSVPTLRVLCCRAVLKDHGRYARYASIPVELQIAFDQNDVRCANCGQSMFGSQRVLRQTVVLPERPSSKLTPHTIEEINALRVPLTFGQAVTLTFCSIPCANTLLAIR